MNSILKESLDAFEHVVKDIMIIHSDEVAQKMLEEGKSIITEVLENEELLLMLQNINSENMMIYRHNNSVMALSLANALKLGLNSTQLHDIVLGAIVHDCGLVDIEMNYIDQDVTVMNAMERLMYRRHVIFGYEKLQNKKWMSEIAKLIVLSHHEKLDGSGYPFHKDGNHIPYEVRLVSICDHLVERIFGIGHCKMRNIDAVRYFETTETSKFDWELMQIVLNNVYIYPVGSTVVLSNGEKGTVIRQVNGNRELPIVQVERDGQLIELDLSQDSELCIEEYSEI